MVHFRGGALILAVAFMVSGCDKKGPECESIVKTINPSVEKLAKLSDPDITKRDEVAEQLKTVAKLTGDSAADLSKLTFTVPELQKFSTEYQASAKLMSEASNELVDVIKTTDKADPVVIAGKVKAASDKMDAAQKAQEPLVENLNKFCGLR